MKTQTRAETSDLAIKLIEELELPLKNEERWAITDQALQKAIPCYLALQEEIKRLTQENEELKSSLDLVHAADMKAIAMWREAHPGNDLVQPDRTEMVFWLLEQIKPSRHSMGNIRGICERCGSHLPEIPGDHQTIAAGDDGRRWDLTGPCLGPILSKGDDPW